MNLEARILEQTYKDRLTVTRKQPVTDEATQETILQDVVIHENVKCALSHSGASAPSKDTNHNRYTANESYAIFTAPDIMCQPGDSAVITTLQGQTYRGTVGKSFSYESHTETALMIEMVV